MPNQRILVISDLHCPYSHPDAIKFLAAIKDKYSPDTIINIGDELDFHAMSFHPSDASLYSAGDELKAGREMLWEVEKLFPRMTLVDSNHGSMAYRKALVAGIPKEIIRPYKSVLDVKYWKWVPYLNFHLPNKQPCHFIHQLSANVRLAMREKMQSVVQGHFHEKFEIVYAGNGERLNFGMTVGCLIDDSSMAFHYNKVFPKRPIIGTGMIIDSQPKLIPLVMKANGRWNGRIN